MSILNSAAIRVAPSAAAPSSVTCAGSFAYGSWVQFIASTSDITQILGVMVGAGTYAQASVEVQFGIGAAGSELAIGSFFLYLPDSGNSGPNIYLMSVPLNLVPTATRVAMRVRCDQALTLFKLGLVYTVASDATEMALSAIGYLPNGAVGVSVTPNGTAWVNSSWVQVAASLAADAYIAGIACSLPGAACEYEIDLGTGAAGAEVVATTVRSAYVSVNSGEAATLWLPAPYGVAAGTRLAVRYRKSGTNTSARAISLIYYGGAVTVTEPSGGGTPTYSPPLVDPSAGVSVCGSSSPPIVWLEIQPAGSATIYRYSKVPINIGTTPITSRVESFGQITRALSTEFAEFKGAAMSPVLIDTDFVLRTLENADSLINARVTVFLSTEAAIRAGSAPRRVFDGIVTDTEPLSGLRFRLQVQDYFGALFQEYADSRTFPQRVFNTTDFPNMANSADLSNPGNPSMVGKPVPIGYGLLSDESLGASAVGTVPAIFVGRRVVNSFNWDEYVVFGHAPSPGGVLTVFGDIDGVRTKFSEDMFGVDIIAPGHEPSWSTHTGSSAPYRDYNGNRYTTFFARGPRSDSAIQGSVPFVVNIGGIEDVGNGTGVMISGLMTQVVHLLINWVFGNYLSGSWLQPPVTPTDLYTRIDVASFAAVQTLSALYVAGGFQGAFLVGADGEATTLSDVLSQAAQSGAFDYGINRHGQLMASMINPSATLNRHIIDITDTVQKTFSARRRRDRLANTVRYNYGKRYAAPYTNRTPAAGARLPGDNAVVSTGAWAVERAQLVDATSVTKYGIRVLPLDLYFVSGAATANAVAGLRLATLKDGPIVDRFTERLCGTDTDLGDRDTLDHFELAPAVNTNHSMRCEVHTLDLDELAVEKEYRDLAPIDYSALAL